jgi:prepilin-type N-terminal cleavage/methylation domain-containing protein
MNKAFTLIELAIVIVVVGLIVSGVVGAQSLIKSANIKQTISSVSKMQTALRAFELEFGEKPGLLRNAYDYWGNECGNNSDDISNGCNGSTNDQCINNNNTVKCRVNNSVSGDMRRLFIHLNLSGIYPDLPMITNASTQTDCKAGKTLPDINLDGVYWIGSRTPRKVYMYMFTPWRFEHIGWSCSTFGESAFLEPKVAEALDSKLDDGNGKKGIVKAIGGNDNFNNTFCMDNNGNYDIPRDRKSCNIRVELE